MLKQIKSKRFFIVQKFELLIERQKNKFKILERDGLKQL